MKRAHTLAELLVVLTILSLVALIVIPRFAETLFRSNLDAAADALRADVTFTRARTISTGLRHQMFLDPETMEITVQPFRPELLENQGAAVQTVPVPVLHDQLPRGIQVGQWTVSPLGYTSATQPTADQPLTFYPEGMGDSALIVLQSSDGERRGFRLDGFTGDLLDMTAEELRQ